MSLFWKLFASIGVAMVVMLVATAYVSYELASRTFDQANIEGREPIIEQAAEVLAQRGERGLREWLRDHTREAPREMVLLIVGVLFAGGMKPIKINRGILKTAAPVPIATPIW